MNYAITIIRMDNNTMQFQSTEFCGVIKNKKVVENILAGKHASFDQVEYFLNLKHTDHTVIETTKNEYIWFIYIFAFE